MTETKSKEKITVIDLPITSLRAFEEHPYNLQNGACLFRYSKFLFFFYPSIIPLVC